MDALFVFLVVIAGGGWCLGLAGRAFEQVWMEEQPQLSEMKERE